MVFDANNIPWLYHLVDSTAVIGDDQGFNAQLFEHADRINDILHREAFVEVESALHDDNLFSTTESVDEVPFVIWHCCGFKVGDIFVGNDDRIGQGFSKSPQCRPQDDSNFRLLARQLCLDELS